MVLWVVCSLFGKLQKLLNERGTDLPLYRTRLWLHTCCRYSNNWEKGNCTHQEIATKKLHSLKKTFNMSHVTLLLGVRPESQHINLHGHACMSSRSVDPWDAILQSSSSELCMWRSLHSAETQKVNIKNALKWHDWMLSQTSAAGPKCRELHALNNVHHKPAWGSTLFTLLSWVTALRHRFMVVWNLPCH